jgi:hypothetical protein
MNLNRIIKKVIKESVRKKLNEANKSSDDDFYILATQTGGVLMIPKSSNPEILERINKAYIKSALSTKEQITNYVSKLNHVTEACNTVYKDMDIDSCYALFVQNMINKAYDGGIVRFIATLPSTGERATFRACWRNTEGGKPLKFDKRFLSGYYPKSDSSGVCSGNPWKIKMDNKKKIEDKDFADKIQFEIKLQMIK